MGKIIFYTGGARSGKSKLAEEYIKKKEYKNKIYFATAVPFDDEMKDRVKKHIDRRGPNWLTIEAYENLVSYLEDIEINKYDVILFDCMTNMVTNQMILKRELDWDKISPEEVNIIEEEILSEIRKFLKFLKNEKVDCVFVSNEIGMGLVPAYSLGRYFRDICGRANQIIAKEADEAYLAVSGIELKLK